VSNWKPIETAPKMRKILVYTGNGIIESWLEGEYWHQDIVEDDFLNLPELLVEPTHWMELPEPPNQ
jgi:hypothetical protein